MVALVLRFVDFVGERFALPLIGVVSLSMLAAVHFLGVRLDEDMLAAVRDSDRGEEVKTMKRATLVLAAVCAGCAPASSGSSLLPGRSPVPIADAGDLVYPDGGDPGVDATLTADAAPLAVDVVAASDAEPAYPSCTAIGYVETDYTTCDPGERTADQRYTCAVCNLATQAPPARWCVSMTKAGDRPSVCVPACGSCPVKIDCDHGPCRVIDGGAP